MSEPSRPPSYDIRLGICPETITMLLAQRRAMPFFAHFYRLTGTGCWIVFPAACTRAGYHHW